jgi:sigma-E factor negative regulatory protein RseC
MTERARVISVGVDSVTLECFDHQGCASCGSAFCNVKARTYDAVVDAGLDVHTGDQVEVFVPPARAIAAGFAVLIFPLILFLAGYLLARPLETEPLRVAAGLGGLIAGFAIVYLVSRKRRKELPRVVRVYKGPELIPVKLPGSAS